MGKTKYLLPCSAFIRVLLHGTAHFIPRHLPTRLRSRIFHSFHFIHNRKCVHLHHGCHFSADKSFQIGILEGAFVTFEEDGFYPTKFRTARRKYQVVSPYGLGTCDYGGEKCRCVRHIPELNEPNLYHS